jgi:hypothetical protein
MNIVCTNLRSRLLITNLADLLFININGPDIQDFDPKSYVRSWLSDNHQSAESMRNTNRSKQEDNENIIQSTKPVEFYNFFK